MAKISRNIFPCGTPGRLVVASVAMLLVSPWIVPSRGQFTPQSQVPPSQMPQMPQGTPIYDSTGFSVYEAYDTGDGVAAQLRNAPPKLYSFDRASLRDVLRFLAEDAGIPFVSMLESVPTAEGQVSPIETALVTFTMRASPFVVLESIARTNDIALAYEEGVWLIRPINERELIGRIYKLKFTPQERVTFEGGTAVANASVPGGLAGQSGASIPNLQRQQTQSIFRVEEPSIIREIKGLLKIQSQGPTGKIAQGEASVENFPPLPNAGWVRPGWGGQGGEGAEQMEPTVTYNSDTNSIYIVATRQQHKWVEGFLQAADQPQALVAIEVKFFETTKDPSKDLGVNWAGTLDQGFTVKVDDIIASPGGSISFSNDNQQLRQSGQLPPGQAAYDYFTGDRRYQASVAAPYSAVLSTSQVAFTINAFMRDRETSIVQYPRVLTVNNREVAISNARNEPILGSSTESQSTITTQTNQVEYLPIGTQLNILPKTMPDGSVFLNVAITISNILNFKQIEVGRGQVNNYPVTSSRIYQAALQVDSGYTLAVGGLEEAFDTLARNGIPLLQDIPGLGELFKNKGRTQNKKNLIVFITPTVIYSRSETSGISQEPVSVLPIRPGGEPRPPAFTPDGQLVGGINALADAIRWLQFQLRFFRQIKDESRVSKKTQDQLRGILNTAMMVQSQIPMMAAQSPGQAPYLGNSEATMETIIRDFHELLSISQKKIIY